MWISSTPILGCHMILSDRQKMHGHVRESPIFLNIRFLTHCRPRMLFDLRAEHNFPLHRIYSNQSGGNQDLSDLNSALQKRRFILYQRWTTTLMEDVNILGLGTRRTKPLTPEIAPPRAWERNFLQTQIPKNNAYHSIAPFYPKSISIDSFDPTIRPATIARSTATPNPCT